MIPLNVREADPEEYIEIINSPNIKEAIEKANNGIMPNYTDSYIVESDKYRLLFTISYVAKHIYETHIACPTDSVRLSRVLALYGLKWISQTYDPEAKAVMTTVNKGMDKVANFVTKIGFRQVDELGDKLYFLYKFN